MELVEALTCNMQSKARGSTVFLFTTKDGAHVLDRLPHEIEIIGQLYMKVSCKMKWVKTRGS